MVSPRNKTLTCTEQEMAALRNSISCVYSRLKLREMPSKLIAGDFFEVAKFLPHGFVDLLFLDPPYNLSKQFGKYSFSKKPKKDYAAWFDSVLSLLQKSLKPTATIYVCADWQTSNIIYPILEQHYFVRNRVTWEREKGRGAKRNWKNNTEDIWFCTMSQEYHFDVDAVKIRRTVLAPYRSNGQPKDWQATSDGNVRLTHPSNIWTDLTVPFWSMAENTPHPAQKPEKLLAKLILASTKQNDFVFDPFLGSGTSVVVAKKLNRNWCGIDINQEYLCWAAKRLIAADESSTIQGYEDGVFWERNSIRKLRSREVQSAYEIEAVSEGAPQQDRLLC
ncbi:MAG: site-specific DNA-methyltransferase [Chloroflexi bacterium]|nr:site-specific DNA-methyltransferase [Chloroflexota bacterium]MYA92028.1 site-specific DNA-methyltransferase [Chloroflexota bacterium]MYC56513.1 site-specific DNA-methyltransferase [Chloroflexota bacterium]MYD37617.1 site-specific DNA-methyltransferase [Chloroflexota bacterium]MYE79430.1 site-specific DNA-methyltransferase [Chloroflexota bacterium]